MTAPSGAGDGSGGDSIYGGKFKDEKAGLKLTHSRVGTVAMANSGKNSNTSQFYIALAELPQLDGKHVVFGQVTEGLDILQRIGASLSYCPLAAAVVFSVMCQGGACSCAVQRRRWHQVTASLEHSLRLQTAEYCDPVLQSPNLPAELVKHLFAVWHQ